MNVRLYQMYQLAGGRDWGCSRLTATQRCHRFTVINLHCWPSTTIHIIQRW